MSDLDPFEKELRQFQPRPASPEVRLRIEDALNRPAYRMPMRSSWADRCLLSALSLGTAAAVMIGTLLILDGRRPNVEEPTAALSSAQQQTRDYLAQMAGGNDLSAVSAH